jgi:hypothetical protein
VQIEAGFDYTGSLEAGFGWSDRRDWYTIDRRESEFTPFGPNVYFNRGEYRGDVCADLDVGLQPGIGAVAEILGFTLFEEEVELAPLTANLIEDACLPWSGPAPSDCAPDSQCCVDGQCPDPDRHVRQRRRGPRPRGDGRV